MCCFVIAAVILFKGVLDQKKGFKKYNFLQGIPCRDSSVAKKDILSQAARLRLSGGSDAQHWGARGIELRPGHLRVACGAKAEVCSAMQRLASRQGPVAWVLGWGGLASWHGAGSLGVTLDAGGWNIFPTKSYDVSFLFCKKKYHYIHIYIYIYIT